MIIEQLTYTDNTLKGEANLGPRAQWVLIFGSGQLLCEAPLIDRIRQLYPKAYLMGCSTAGEIHDDTVADDTLCITAIAFEKARIEFQSHALSHHDAFEAGKNIISAIRTEDLKHIFVLSEGLNINGSQLVMGMRSAIDVNIPISGGLAGDGTDFKTTFLIGDGKAAPDQIVLAALYGDIRIGCASFGGWDTFGIERVATKTQENILFELDGKPALDLYKEYLGDKSKELPASALLFPLSIRMADSDVSYVRTILAVDEEKKSLIFAGDIPLNAYCKLMKSNSSKLIDGSMKAAEWSMDMLQTNSVQLAILVSCVGRKLVLKQRVDEEVEAVRDVVGSKATITGFYSYGEISPYKMNTMCELHNQTMTITLMSEEESG